MMLGPCFACHEYGHLRSTCPKLGITRSSMYPLSSDESDINEVGYDYSNMHDVHEIKWVSDNYDNYGTGESLSVSESYSIEEECLEGLNELISVKGRLRECYEYWSNMLHAPESILSIIREGYFLPLVHEPPQFCRSNNRSVRDHEGFVTDSIMELVSQQCVREVSSRPQVCSPLLVVVNGNSGKKRLVISLKYLNLFLWKDKFKYEDIRTAMDYFERGGYMCIFDLKSGYHHVDVCELSQKYLGFEWKGAYYVFTVLPFGLASACYVFAKLLRPVVKFFRAQGQKLVVYVDDGILIGANYQQTKRLCDSVVETLGKTGFVLNRAKSCLEPQQSAKWLGFKIDLEKGSITMPSERIAAVCEIISNMLSAPRLAFQVRKIAAVVGKLISFSIAIGPIARLRTRALYGVILTRHTWSSVVTLSDEALEELKFWLANLEFFNGQPLWRSPSAVWLVYSDASDTGYGGYLVEHGAHVAQGMWTPDESKLSSTWRELQAVALVLESIAPKLAHTNIRWFTDNQNVVRIISVGSKKEHLQQVAMRIFSFCFANRVVLEAEWIPRRDNELADYYSRVIDVDDWGISQCAFDRCIDSCWGPHSVDRFASSYNTKLARINSRFWNPDTEAVDAFTVDWSGENNYLCPPVCLIARVLYHACACECTGTLIVPEWPSAWFWPLLYEGHSYRRFVVGVRCLPLMESLVVPGKRGGSLFKSGVPNTNVLALRVDFTHDCVGSVPGLVVPVVGH